MQITISNSASREPDPSAGGGIRKSLSPAAPAAAFQPQSEPQKAASLRLGLRGVDLRSNETFGNAQQALAYLDELDAQLEHLKSDVSTQLASGQSNDSSLGNKLKRFSSLWRQRQDAAAGALDGRLGYSGKEPARTSFRIRGLDMRTLQSLGRETLEFSIDGASDARVVMLEPGIDKETVIRRFDKALAPIGIRAGEDGKGGMVFSAPEPAWPALRDTMAVKGGGIRFPAGQFNRVQAEAEPEAIRPDGWKTGDITALRQTLKEIVNAQDLVRQARSIVQRSIADAGKSVEHSDGQEQADWARSFAERFEKLTQEPGYQALSAIAPALVSISRGRVTALLAQQH